MATVRRATGMPSCESSSAILLSLRGLAGSSWEMSLRILARIAIEELLARCPAFHVDAERGRFAPGHFVRRYESLPFQAKGAR